MASPELIRCASAVGAAAGIWFVVQVRQVSARNPLARLGDCTYGLYLMHVPVIFVGHGIYLSRYRVPQLHDVLAIGAAAVVVGLLFGRFESWLHARLRPLARADVRAWLGGTWHGRARLRLEWRGVSVGTGTRGC
jgi:peptidoglycan/LPS O-acetylase OafA/YrhL